VNIKRPCIHGRSWPYARNYAQVVGEISFKKSKPRKSAAFLWKFGGAKREQDFCSKVQLNQ
jgi:hypothetical protein